MSNGIFDHSQNIEKLYSLTEKLEEPQLCEILNALYDTNPEKALDLFRALFYKY